MTILKKIYSLFRRFNQCANGIATIEFGAWMAFLALPLLVGLDYGFYNIKRVQMNSAVNSAAVVAFQSRENISASQIQNIVHASWDDNMSMIDVRCNGQVSCVNTNRPCACISGFSSGAPQFTNSSCTASCASGAAPGYYMTIAVSADYDPIFGAPFVTPPDTIGNTVTVRMQ